MIVVDVNIIAYLLIQGEHTHQARALRRHDADWRVPVLWRHEYLNILATYARHGGISPRVAGTLWWQASTLLEGCGLEPDMPASLALAIERKISAYDAQYAALAHALGTVCVTQDRRLLEAAPEVTRSIDQFLAR